MVVDMADFFVVCGFAFFWLLDPTYVRKITPSLLYRVHAHHRLFYGCFTILYTKLGSSLLLFFKYNFMGKCNTKGQRVTEAKL